MVNSNSGWTVDTLKEMVDQRFADNQKAVETALLAQEKAVSIAFVSQEKAVNCVSADTPILCADLIWRPAGDLQVGDELIAFDETPTARNIDSIASRGRMYRKAVVTSNFPMQDKLFLVNTPVGSVRCNAEHPWLVRRQDKLACWQWVKTADLRVGDGVMHALDVWETDKSWEAGWLAGMFDGEGCLSFKNSSSGKARLSIVQRVSETSEAIKKSLESRLDSFGIRNRIHLKKEHSPTTEFEINVKADIMKILGSIRPPRLLVNADKVWEGLTLSSKKHRTVITSIEDAGVGTIASLTTSTSTYIAGGFAMHNTALLAAKEAVIKAEILTDKRFDAVTEAVGQVSAKTVELLPRAEYAAAHGALNDKILVVTDALNRSSGDKNLYATNAFVTETVSHAINNLESKMESILGPLSDYIIAQKGASQSGAKNTDNIFKIIAAFASILGILGVFAAIVMAVVK